jgi:hypothetical protein
MTAPSLALGALISVVQPLAGTVSKKFYADAFMFEAASYVGGYFDDITQATENKYVDLALAPLPQPHLTGMKLQADISLNDFTFNTVDEYGVVWVVTDIGGWWQHPSPTIPEVSRGWGDGSYDVKGKYNNLSLSSFSLLSFFFSIYSISSCFSFFISYGPEFKFL